MPITTHLLNYQINSLNDSQAGPGSYNFLPWPGFTPMNPGDGSTTDPYQIFAKSADFATLTPGPVVQANLYANNGGEAQVLISQTDPNDDLNILAIEARAYGWNGAQYIAAGVVADANDAAPTAIDQARAYGWSGAAYVAVGAAADALGATGQVSIARLYGWYAGGSSYAPALCDSAGNLYVNALPNNSAFANSDTGVGIATTVIAAANANRKSLTIQNLGATDIWVSWGAAPAVAAAPSFKISAGATFTWNNPAPNQAVNAISTLANNAVTVVEG